MTFNVLDNVVLDKDLPEFGLQRGDLGTVVELYGSDGMEIEFVTASGETEVVATVSAAHVRPVSKDDLLAVRPRRRTA